MESFEKAHVAKSKKSTRKDKKSEVNVKNQLKQMLLGYQHSDNNLIISSAESKKEFEDSSSVSGYSDLNLTNSSAEGSITLGTISSGQNDISFTSEISLDKSELNSYTSDNLSHLTSIESICDQDKHAKVFFEETSEANVILTEESEDDSLNDSFIVTSTDVDSTSNDDSEFDADGALAKKIFEKLKKTKKDTLKDNKKSKKRKFNEIDGKKSSSSELKQHDYKGTLRPQDDQEDDDKLDTLSNELANISLPENKEFSGPYRPDHEGSEQAVFNDNMSQNDTSIDSYDPSSPFVSVVATDMTSHRLSDILGEYKHPTIKNLPSESQNIYSTFETGLFETENVSVIDIQNEEEVCSLIPEIDNESRAEDIIDLDVDFDTSVQPIDESTANDDTIQSENISEREMSTDSIELTLINPVKVYYGKNNTCVFVMKHPAEMYVHGKVKVKSLGGTVEVLGHTLQDKLCDVYAPNYNYAQQLKTVENHNAYYGLFGNLTASGLSVATAEDIVTTIGEYDGIISMQPLKSGQMNYVENDFEITDLFSKPSKNIENCFKAASEILGCSLYLTKPWKSFEENAIWKQVIQCGLNKQSRGIVCGGKGVGKSTFLRYYVNRLLATGPVLVIDLDPGQCEFTVAGNVSATVVTEPLLGPNFTHLRTPEMMLHIGMINTMDNPRRYAAAVESIITHCHNDERLRRLPWIVNTMGMTNTIGLKFTSLIVLQTQPTFLLQIDSKNAKRRFDFHLYPQTIKNLYFEDYQTDRMFRNISDVTIDYSFFLSHYTDSPVRNNFSLAPKDERYLNYLAYFGEMLNRRSGDILHVVPYEVNLKDLNIGLNVKITEESVTKVINGKIVALCRHAAPRKVFRLTDTPLICIGAGVIRGVDYEKGVVYVVSPAAATRLAGADTLVYADWAGELRGAGGAVPAGTLVPYLAAGAQRQRRLLAAPRRRFNPLQLLKMSRTS